ncbi:methyl-accepting chemotaxis protein [Rhodovibrio salinarum]|uniref:Methyl-accepting chemotaxis protein n=1 Tax=Rhodovibrio salinarum TaxID=1087 RepID=A0A934QIH6_9PROT|nr:methyl-accepting chemotaxis protein [Rhodovibrio salinarum]MBK1697611.1 methyl-accepting chemotaxis protein [Rhodovibrio salinarum]
MFARFQNLSVSRKIQISFALLLVLSIGVMGFIMLKIQDASDAQHEAAQTSQIMTALDHVEGAVRDQQNGIRGFLISGDSAALRSYGTGMVAYGQWIDKLRQSLVGTEYVGKVEEMDRAVKSWVKDVASPQIRWMQHPDTVPRARAMEAVGAGAADLATFARIEEALRDWGAARMAERSAAQDTAFTWVYAATGGATLALLVASIVCGVSLSRLIARPLGRMTAAMSNLSHGDKDTPIPDTDRKDEFGGMAQAVQVFKDSMERSEELARKTAEEQEARAQRAQQLEQLSSDFEQAVTGLVQRVSSSTEQLAQTASSLSSLAEDTKRQSTEAASAADQASNNVDAVASAAEQLTSSIEEIARQMGQSNEIASKTSTEASEANEVVQALNSRAQEISDVVGLINDIAEKTNLLALNATIEAARAGEAGKGFAVVAQEVKQLANQTAKATGEIGSQIQSMQSATGSAVDALNRIIDRVGEINEITTAVASAVEEQQAATSEIARNVEQAATGASEVSRTISQVSDAAATNGTSAQDVSNAGSELSRETETLRKELDTFLSGIRAA